MDYFAFKEAVIAKATAMGIGEYELYYQTVEATNVRIFGQEVDRFSASNSGGVCFRCIVGGKMGYASTELLTPEEATALVERAVDNALVLEAEEPVFLGEGGKTYREISREEYPMPEARELIDTALAAQSLLYEAHPAVTEGTTTQGLCQVGELAIYNSKGLDLYHRNAVAGLVVGAVVEENGEKASDYQFKLGRLDTIDTRALAEKAAQTALGKLGGQVPPTGNVPVVFDPEAMSDLLGVFSGIFSAEAAQKGLSRFADREGQAVAAPIVTIIDDPFHPENPMPMCFDAEGSPTYTKKLVDGGVLTTLLYNLKTAAVAGRATTGNGSKAGYDSPVKVQPFSMYLAGGDMTPEELLKQAGEGVFINALSGLHAGANPVTGDFSLQSAGYLIEKGEKTAAIKSFTVAGNFYELLQNIAAVANDAHLPNALGETTFGAPTTLVQGLSIAGK